MKTFLIRLIKFFSITICFISILVVASVWISSLLFQYKLPKEAHILILGNSHPECAIDDSDYPALVSLARSGSAYYYDYLKLREFTKRNPQIDTIILGYTYHDLQSEMNDWITGEDKLKFKLRNHLILFNFSDYWDLLLANPWGVLKNTPQGIIYSFYTVYKGYSYIGGYKYLDRNKLTEAIEFQKNKPKILSGQEKSKYQIHYLQKIYTFCMKNNLELILLHTPIHPMEIEFYNATKDEYRNYAKQNLPSATLIYHADLKLEDKFFADLDHLNYMGAREYTPVMIEALGRKDVYN